jgi:competence protein ComEC
MLRSLLPGFFLIALFVSSGETLHAQSRNLDIYWIDVEGGAATLIVSPSGESMLIDTGHKVEDDRDAKRIFAATQLAGLKKIDYLVISQFRGDHVGGLTALAKMIPIGKFFDHNDVTEKENQDWIDSYRAVAAGERTSVKAGDKIPLKGVQALVVSSGDGVLAKAINGGGPNPLCANAEQKAPAAPENQRTLGMLLTYGKFKFLDLGDLDWEKEIELACPVNKLGSVTVYQTSGAFDAAAVPAFLGAIKPQVVVVNNEPTKRTGNVDDRLKSLTPSGTQTTQDEKNLYEELGKIAGIEGIWQVHRSIFDKSTSHNTSQEMSANVDDNTDCRGNWVKASVGPDGKFTVTNGRNGFSWTYATR